jgi:hypothetical protein
MGAQSRFNIHNQTDAERWRAVLDALENLPLNGGMTVQRQT